MNCGLLGESLKHSYSPQIHRFLGSYTYSIFEKQENELETFLASGTFHGINVTIPYKKSVIPYCSQLSETAQKLGAVNTVVRGRDGALIGHNTDYYGFQYMLQKSGLEVSGKKALVLGSGGASATAVAVLKESGADVLVISRQGENNYCNLHKHQDASLIVNATPVGMYPHTGKAPLDVTQFPHLEGVLDLIYNPARTQLLLDAEALGIPSLNGLWMLVAQAKESAEWFTCSKIDDAIIPQIYKELQSKQKNIVLVGMPGSGKTSVGRYIASITQREFVDADELIVQKAGMTIPQIFQNLGEATFREMETAVLEEIGNKSGLIIATGGGCVTRLENYPLLHQNGTIFWIQRPVESLPTAGRPLSLSGSLTKMYADREPMYRYFADYILANDTVENAANEIIRLGALK